MSTHTHIYNTYTLHVYIQIGIDGARARYEKLELSEFHPSRADALVLSAPTFWIFDASTIRACTTGIYARR